MMADVISQTGSKLLNKLWHSQVTIPFIIAIVVYRGGLFANASKLIVSAMAQAMHAVLL